MGVNQRELTLDVAKPWEGRPCKRLVIRQGDENADDLRIKVTSLSEPVDLTGMTARFVACLSDGTYTEAACSVEDVEGGVVRCTLDSGFSSVAGMSRAAYVELSKGSEVVASTESVALSVRPRADLSKAQQAAYGTRLDTLTEEYEQLVSDAEEAMGDVQEALASMGLPVYACATASDAVPRTPCIRMVTGGDAIQMIYDDGEGD